MKKHRVGIVVLNWNNYFDTAQCMHSLENSNNIEFQIVIVDSGSIDGSANRLALDFPGCTILRLGENRGFSGGMNAGLSELLETTEYILCCNNDVIFDENALQLMVETADRYPQAAAIGPRVISNQDRTLFQKRAGVINIWKSKSDPKWQHETPADLVGDANEVLKLPGACFLVRTDFVKNIGLMDERYFLYYADTDWQARMREKGYRLINEPRARVYHKISSTIRRTAKESFYYDTRDLLYFVSQYYPAHVLTYSFINLAARRLISLIFDRQNKSSKSINMLALAYWHFIFGVRGKTF